jgi:hypothetical protein
LTGRGEIRVRVEHVLFGFVFTKQENFQNSLQKLGGAFEQGTKRQSAHPRPHTQAVQPPQNLETHLIDVGAVCGVEHTPARPAEAEEGALRVVAVLGAGVGVDAFVDVDTLTVG